ncbi:MAG: 2-phospho-L-lactate transferase CofD family protein [Acidimicrobiia bacterium]|nr:2-phospho-L-lactate transferase CofD family protein [Acidimicrobiia bacterium]MDH5423106.1 2-phospho-L-lactate transferase CofD family protein [Acidimicrobiia bacterium]MDH5502892.1 2-phospho-L-lactate transferase CofD family protein [Acidimicrobiia bacterium]
MNVVMLSGGVGGARLARGLARAPGIDLTLIVNVGDDDTDYGLAVSPDIDTVLYTVAGVESEAGWGLAYDSFAVMARLEEFGVNTTMRIGDRDLAGKLFRTMELYRGIPLSEITGRMAEVIGLEVTILPASDNSVRTEILTPDDEWLSFREYFVHRAHKDDVIDIRFAGADRAVPAPGVLEAIANADAVIVGPSNPPLSIWPILAIPGIAPAIIDRPRVVGVSPLIGGKALKGPADQVLLSLGLPPGNEGVLAAYDGVVNELVIDQQDATDRGALTALGARVHVRNTRLATMESSVSFAEWLIEIL